MSNFFTISVLANHNLLKHYSHRLQACTYGPDIRNDRSCNSLPCYHRILTYTLPLFNNSPAVWMPHPLKYLTRWQNEGWQRTQSWSGGSASSNYGWLGNLLISLYRFSPQPFITFILNCCYFDHLTFTIHCMFSLHLKVLYLHNVRTSFLPTSHCCGIQILGMWQFYQKRSHRPLTFLSNLIFSTHIADILPDQLLLRSSKA